VGQASTIGLDIAKRVFQAHGADAAGRVVFRKRLTRAKVLEFFAAQPPCVVAMEACAGAHHWAREIGALGHEVRLMSPEYVRPYVKAQKNVWPTPSASGLAVGPGTVCCNVSGPRAKPSATMEIRAARSS
jgi:hypothetical protein